MQPSGSPKVRVKVRAIIVDNEPLMMRKFERLTGNISDLDLVGKFEDAKSALSYAKDMPVDVAFLDVEMPIMDGIALAERLKEINREIIIVFITAFDEYIRDSNIIGGDYYIIKPYTRQVLNVMMEKIRVLATRQSKTVFIETFGRFVVKKNNIPITLTGKAKEILAFVVTKQGREVSNEEIYSTIWENRPYSNEKMTVYYNALRRLKSALCAADLQDLLISTVRGQMVNTNLFDCDYYKWKEEGHESKTAFEGEFLSEYSWAEVILSELFWKEKES